MSRRSGFIFCPYKTTDKTYPFLDINQWLLRKVSGDLKSEWQLVAGEKIHGTYTAYYKNKKIHYTGTYRNGELEGIVKAFYENGKPEAVISYHNGK